MSNLSKQRRDQMIAALDEMKEKSNEEQQLVLLEIKNELIEKKYGLVWEEHEEKVDIDLKDKVPVFKEKSGKKIKLENEEKYNFLLEGDNLHSLYLLEKTHKGKIDVIYIDPPYNTMSEGFVYNDKIVNKEDGFRHSKWLSLINERLVIAQKLLSKEGVILISIDDNEMPQLKLLCDEIFGTENFIANIPTIMNLKGNQDQLGFAGTHEYTLVYCKNRQTVKFEEFPIDVFELDEDWIKDDKGFYKLGATIKRTGNASPREQRPTTFYPILEKEGYIYTIEPNEYEKIYDKKTNTFDDDFLNKLEEKYTGRGFNFILPVIKDNFASWRWSIQTVEENSDEIIIKYVGDNVSLYKKQRPQLGDFPSKKPKSIFYKPEYSSGNGTSELQDIFLSKVFNNPKPLQLIKDLIIVASNKDSIILDFFAGSGTTGQAVLELNKLDKGDRKFILCTNNENQICEEITFPRLKTVITGLRVDGSKYSNGIPANLKYFKTEWVSRNSEYLEDELSNRISEMIELENHIEIDNEKYVIVMSQKDALYYLNDTKKRIKIKKLWHREDILFSSEQLRNLERIKTAIIPRNYFDIELKEGGYYA